MTKKKLLSPNNLNTPPKLKHFSARRKTQYEANKPTWSRPKPIQLKTKKNKEAGRKCYYEKLEVLFY